MSLPCCAARRRFLVFALLATAGCGSLASAQAPTATVGDVWTQLTKPGDLGPSGTYSAGIAYDELSGRIVSFGGDSSDDSGYYPTVPNTTVWDGNFWRVASTTGPPPTFAPSMAYDPTNQAVVMAGGQVNDGSAPNTWFWNGLTETWTTPYPSYPGTYMDFSPYSSPPPYPSGGMAYDVNAGNLVYYGGGVVALQNQNSTYLWDGMGWTVGVTGPPGIFDAGFARDVTGDLIWFGGQQGGTTNTYGDTWKWNGTWTQLAVSGAGPRTGPAMAYDAGIGKTVLFGGSYGGTGPFSDTWLWDGAAWTQSLVNTYDGTTWSTTEIPSPPVSQFSVMAYDATNGEMVKWGGYNYYLYVASGIYETWVYGHNRLIAPNTAVGSTSSTPLTVYFNLTTAGALGTTQVLTQGAPNLDFTLGTGGSCVTSAPTGICTVNVNFKPTAPGLRTGAVNLTDANNNVIATAFISGTGTGPLAAFTPGIITTVVGNGTQCADSTLTPPCGDGGVATNAALFAPQSVAVDGAGNLYVVDAGDLVVRKIDTTGIITTVAGNGTSCAGGTCGDGGPATSASFMQPAGLALDGAGNLYISDGAANTVRKVTAATGIISTVAGNGTACPGTSSTAATGACGDLRAASTAELNSPLGIALDTAGNLYIADTADNRIRKVSAASGVISTIVGTGYGCQNSRDTSGACGDGALAFAATVTNPYGVRVDGAGNVYIADAADERVRKITATTGLISTVAGNGNPCATYGCGDGALATDPSVAISTPAAIALDAAGDVYIVATGESTIRKISASTGMISTIVGNGTACTTAATTGCGDGTAANSATAELYQPLDVALDGTGNLYIADFFDNLVRKVSTGGDIQFATATTAGIGDATDGTQTATLNNIGNATLTITNQASLTSDFQLGNPTSDGCSTASSVGAGSSCLVGAMFTPQASDSSGVVTGAIVTTDNSGATHTTTLTGAAIALLSNTITFPQPASPVTAGGSATLGATSTSGNVVYTVTSGTATISGSTITYTNSGTVQITATSPTDGTYAPAAPVSVTVVVSPLPSTAAWVPATNLIYTGAALSAGMLDATDSVPATIVYSAYLASASPSSATAVAVGTQLGAGSYVLLATITPTDPSYATQTLTISFSVQNMNVFVVGAGAVSSLYNNGAEQSAATSGGGIGAAVDSAGYVWSINMNGTSLSKFNDAGVFSASYSPGGVTGASALAMDGNSNVWVANGNGTISLVSNAGVSLLNISGSTSAAPSGVAVDLSGNVWVANPTGNSLDEMLGGAAPVMPLVNGVLFAVPGTRP